MKDLFKKICCLAATVFGLGYLLPIGQGTITALAALFFILPFVKLSFLWQAVLLTSGIFFGVFASSCAEKKFGRKDDHRIVIDEFVSIFISFVGLRAADLSFLMLGAGFFLNRFLDCLKPFPLYKAQKLSGGWGIMTDDILVGVYVNIFLRLALYFIF